MAPSNPDSLPSYDELKQRAEAALSAGKEDGAAASDATASDGAAAGDDAAKKARPLTELSSGQAQRFRSLLRSFQHAGAVIDQALALYVNSKVRPLMTKRRQTAPLHHTPPCRAQLRGLPSTTCP